MRNTLASVMRSLPSAQYFCGVDKTDLNADTAVLDTCDLKEDIEKYFSLLVKEVREKSYYYDNVSRSLVEDVCKSVYISRYYLTHLFKDYGGVSPLRYIISKRMEKAKLGNSWSYSILLVCMNLRRGGKSNSEVTSEHSICGAAV